jgi:hypothetical protein
LHVIFYLNFRNLGATEVGILDEVMDITGPFSNLEEWENHINKKQIQNSYQKLFEDIKELIEKDLLYFTKEENNNIKIS